MNVPRKGLRDIRTRTGGVERTHSRHRAFLKVAMLEMEKERRNKERESAEARIKTIDNRLCEIEKEKEVLLKLLATEEPKAVPAERQTAPATVPLPRPGRTLRY